MSEQPQEWRDEKLSTVYHALKEGDKVIASGAFDFSEIAHRFNAALAVEREKSEKLGWLLLDAQKQLADERGKVQRSDQYRQWWIDEREKVEVLVDALEKALSELESSGGVDGIGEPIEPDEDVLKEIRDAMAKVKEGK